MQTKEIVMPLDPPSQTKVPIEVVVNLTLTDEGAEISSADPALRVSDAFITYFLKRKERHRLVRFIFPDEVGGYFVELTPSDLGLKNRLTLGIDEKVDALIAFLPKTDAKPKVPFKITIRIRQKGGGE